METVCHRLLSASEASSTQHDDVSLDLVWHNSSNQVFVVHVLHCSII